MHGAGVSAGGGSHSGQHGGAGSLKEGRRHTHYESHRHSHRRIGRGLPGTRGPRALARDGGVLPDDDDGDPTASEEEGEEEEEKEGGGARRGLPRRAQAAKSSGGKVPGRKASPLAEGLPVGPSLTPGSNARERERERERLRMQELVPLLGAQTSMFLWHVGGGLCLGPDLALSMLQQQVEEERGRRRKRRRSGSLTGTRTITGTGTGTSTGTGIVAGTGTGILCGEGTTPPSATEAGDIAAVQNRRLRLLALGGDSDSDDAASQEDGEGEEAGEAEGEGKSHGGSGRGAQGVTAAIRAAGVAGPGGNGCTELLGLKDSAATSSSSLPLPGSLEAAVEEIRRLREEQKQLRREARKALKRCEAAVAFANEARLQVSECTNGIAMPAVMLMMMNDAGTRRVVPH